MEDLNNASFDNIYSIDYNKDFKGYFEKDKTIRQDNRRIIRNPK